jgi:hypothetical protein
VGLGEYHRQVEAEAEAEDLAEQVGLGEYHPQAEAEDLVEQVGLGECHR